MRLFTVILCVLLLGVGIASAYFYGQNSASVVSAQEISVNALSVVSTIPCLVEQLPKEIKPTLSFPLIADQKKAVIKKKKKPRKNLKYKGKPPKETIDTVVIHAIRDGRWSKSDNKVLLYYLSNLDKKQRIAVLKHLNHAINYQQMDVGKEFNMPRF